MACSACAIEFANDISCELYLLIVLAFFNSLIPILIRIAHVFSAYEVSKIYAQDLSANAENQAMSKGSVFLRRAELLQSIRVQATVLISFFLLHLVVWVVYTQGFRTNCEGVDELIGIALFGIAYMSVTFYLSWNISTLKDGLYIRREMLLVALSGVVMIIAFLVLRIVSGEYYYANFAFAFGPFWMVAVQIIMPLYKSYTFQYNRGRTSELESSIGELSLTTRGSKEKRGSQGTVVASAQEKPNSAAAFHRLLASQHGYELFLEYSRLELSHENILFYHEVTPLLEKAKKQPEVADTREFAEVALRIYNKYVSHDAKLQVNLSAAQVAKFTAAAFDEGADALDGASAVVALQEAWKAIFSLMFRDTYARFRRSPRYKEYLAHDI